MVYCSLRLRVMLVAVAASSAFLISIGLGQVPPDNAPAPQTLEDKIAAEDRVDSKDRTHRLEREAADNRSRAELETQRRQDDSRRRELETKGWIDELKPLSNGGWTLKNYGDEYSWAFYISTHQRKRAGEIVTLWTRVEQRDAVTQSGYTYFSSVAKTDYDCANARTRLLSFTSYRFRNLSGDAHSEDIDRTRAPWQSVIPGSQGEYILQYACSVH